MATRIDMPQLGLTMETGTILQWLKAVGDTVEKGQPVVLIQTDKVEYEVESPAAGTLLKVAAQEGAGLVPLPGTTCAALCSAQARNPCSLAPSFLPGRRPSCGRSSPGRLLGEDSFTAPEMPANPLTPEGVLGMNRVRRERSQIRSHFEARLIEGLQVFPGRLHIIIHDIPEIACTQQWRTGRNPRL